MPGVPTKTRLNPRFDGCLVPQAEVALTRTRSLLAEGGAEFGNYYGHVPICCPGRASYLTGAVILTLQIKMRCSNTWIRDVCCYRIGPQQLSYRGPHPKHVSNLCACRGSHLKHVSNLCAYRRSQPNLKPRLESTSRYCNTRSRYCNTSKGV